LIRTAAHLPDGVGSTGGRSARHKPFASPTSSSPAL
jgi:hypothetical protein